MGLFPLHSLFQKYADSTAWKSETYQKNYDDIWSEVEFYREELRNLGIDSSMRIAFAFQSPQKTLLYLFAIWELGASAIPLSHKYPKAYIEELSNTASFNFFLNDEGIHIFSKKVEKVQAEALIVFTSGSTAAPKAVVLSEENLYYSALGTNNFYQLKENDSWQLSLPLFHVGGIMIALRCLLAGASLSFDHQQANFFSLVPTQLQRMIKDPLQLPFLQKAKAILLGGGPSSFDLIEQAKKYNIPISHTYGQTESCAQLTATRPGEYDHSSVGEVLPYRQLEINQERRIIITGKTLFLGYLIQNKFEFPFISRKFITQDLGELREKKLHLQGRADQVFISGGENISPFEIQKELLNLPGIKEAYIIPITHEQFGSVPFAFYSTDENHTGDKLKNLLKEKLPAYKVPKYFLDLSEYQRTGLKYTTKQLQTIAMSYLKENS